MNIKKTRIKSNDPKPGKVTTHETEPDNPVSAPKGKNPAEEVDPLHIPTHKVRCSHGNVYTVSGNNSTSPSPTKISSHPKQAMTHNTSRRSTHRKH